MKNIAAGTFYFSFHEPGYSFYFFKRADGFSFSGPQAFEAESRKRVRELHLYDVLRADRCISSNSLEARVPFGDLDFVRYVMHLRPALKMNTHGKGKYLLRKAFAQGGYLPESILWREKAAFSDAVGHSLADELKAYAESIYSDEDLARAASRCGCQNRGILCRALPSGALRPLSAQSRRGLRPMQQVLPCKNFLSA